MATLSELHTMEEAAKHNKKGDCWVVIDGKIYDVSTYLDDHPGGDDVLLAVTGKDATEEFEDAGHSNSARELLKNFCIGELEDTPTPLIPQLEIVKKQQENLRKQLMNLTKQYGSTVSVAAVGLAVIVSVFYLRRKK